MRRVGAGGQQADFDYEVRKTMKEHVYHGATVTPTQFGFIVRRSGCVAENAKTLRAAYGLIDTANRKGWKSTGAVLPAERDTNRIEREWAEKELRDRG